MTTQREPDTSAEGLRKLYDWHREPDWAGNRWSVTDWLSRKPDVEFLRALADAAGQAAPVPPPVAPGDLEPHDDREKTVVIARTAYDWCLDDNGRLCGLIAGDHGYASTHIVVEEASNGPRIAEHDRADGLAKEVESLNEAGRFASEMILQYKHRAEAAEAKLAVYEAPIGDGEVEDAIRGLGIVRDLIKSKRKHLLGGKFSGLDAALTMLEADAALFRRLSAAHAECKGENTKLREALQHMSGPPWTMRLARIDQRTDIERQACDLQAAIEKLGGHPLLTDASLCADRAARFLGKWHDEGEPGTALAPASEEKAT